MERETGGASGTTIAAFVACQLFNCALTLPSPPSSDPFHWASRAALFALVPLVYLITSFQWPVNPFEKWMKLAITDDGIEAGPRKMSWSEIESISHGLPFWRSYPLVRIIRKKKNSSFFTLDINASDLTIFSHSFVHLDLIPHIKAEHPHIRISEEFPSPSAAKKARSLASSLLLASTAIAQTAILSVIANSMETGNFLLIQFLAILIAPLSLSATFACRDFREASPGASFLRGAVAGIGIAMPLALFGFYVSPTPPWVFSALSLFGMIILTAGVILSTATRAGRALPPLMATTLIGAGIFSILRARHPDTLNDASAAFSGEAPLYVWSADGRYLADASSMDSETKRCLLDVKTGELKLLKSHPGGDVIAWMNDSIVLRLTKATDRSTLLLVHHIKSGREFILDKAPRISVSMIAPVSPDGKTLVWLISSRGDRNPQIKTSRITDAPHTQTTHLIPLSDEYKWRYVDWNGKNALVIRGTLRNAGEQGTGNLVLTRLNLKTKKSTLTVFNHKAGYWYPLKGFKHAFTESRVVGRDGSRLVRIANVNLLTGKVALLPGASVPSWPDDNGFAYRTAFLDDRNYLLRFDLHSEREEKLTRIPDDLRLLGVSKDGKTAVFAHNWKISPASYPVYDVSTGTWSTLETAGFAAASTGHGTLVLMSPLSSMWSPDSRTAVFETLECALPERRIKAKTKLWRPRAPK